MTLFLRSKRPNVCSGPVLRPRGGATYAAAMVVRSWITAAMIAGFVGVLAHTTAATQCPAREEGACAKVHALMLRRSHPVMQVASVVPPMPAHAAEAAPLQVASASRASASE